MSSIGIIGGSDGPTAIFVSGFSLSAVLIGLAAIVILALGLGIYITKRNK